MIIFVQFIFSLIAILFLFYLNKKLGGFTPARFQSEQMAKDIIKQDFPNTKASHLGQLLFLDNSTAIFEYIDSDKGNEDAFIASQAIGDNFVSRKLPIKLLMNSAENIIADGHKYSLTITPQDITMTPITIQFSDADPLYYWLYEQNISFPALSVKNEEMANATN